MSLVLITAPAEEPVTLSEAKLHLRVDHSADDTLITALIVAAREQAEHKTGRVLVTQTWEQVLDAFPADEMRLDVPPVQSITSVKYLDEAGDEQTLDGAAYSLDAAKLPGWLFPASEWPATYDGANAVRVRMVCGYGAASAVPATIKAWMLLHVGAGYRQREAFAQGAAPAELPNRYVDALLDSARVYL